MRLHLHHGLKDFQQRATVSVARSRLLVRSYDALTLYWTATGLGDGCGGVVVVRAMLSL